MSTVHDVQFELVRNINYHVSRELFFSRVAKILVGMQVLTSTAAFAAIVGTVGINLAKWVALFGASIGIFLLIIDPAAAAREHRIFRARYTALLADLELSSSDEKAALVRSEIYRISGEEPPAYSAARALAYNETVDALFEEKEAETLRLGLSFADRMTAHLLPKRGKTFKPPSNA
ncbi:hypothetical protein [Roseibium polysiphoniae]|uniref:SMODS and SLOG-associating 2TM effector domain-containing protein n=1 Tax=Roseibium polysiphoniae TaxID=2571221 RepID=A0ABR9CFN6_9HYPH|nr:hypothetical protein [Roseibium polysiphoniae]MBD8877702.1 hypothetical protein [Roseibium polysiphoniae]